MWVSLMSQVLSQLTAKREVTAERQEFFVYADLFGIMVLTNHIKIHSASPESCILHRPRRPE